MDDFQPPAKPTHNQTSADKLRRPVLRHPVSPANQYDDSITLPCLKTEIDAQYPHPFAAFRVDSLPEFFSAIHNRGGTQLPDAKYLRVPPNRPVRSAQFAPKPVKPAEQPATSVHLPVSVLTYDHPAAISLFPTFVPDNGSDAIRRIV